MFEERRSERENPRIQAADEPALPGLDHRAAAIEQKLSRYLICSGDLPDEREQLVVIAGSGMTITVVRNPISASESFYHIVLTRGTSTESYTMRSGSALKSSDGGCSLLDLSSVFGEVDREFDRRLEPILAEVRNAELYRLVRRYDVAATSHLQLNGDPDHLSNRLLTLICALSHRSGWEEEFDRVSSAYSRACSQIMELDRNVAREMMEDAESDFRGQIELVGFADRGAAAHLREETEALLQIPGRERECFQAFQLDLHSQCGAIVQNMQDKKLLVSEAADQVERVVAEAVVRLANEEPRTLQALAASGHCTRPESINA